LLVANSDRYSAVGCSNCSYRGWVKTCEIADLATGLGVKGIKRVPNSTDQRRVHDVIRAEPHWRRRVFAVHDAVQIASHDPAVLLGGAATRSARRRRPVSARSALRLAARLAHFTALTATTIATVTPTDVPEQLDRQGDREQRRHQLQHGGSLAPAADTAPRLPVVDPRG
jgi:hypothetical protein